MKKTFLMLFIVVGLVVAGKLYVDSQTNDNQTSYGNLGGDFTLEGVDGKVSLSQFQDQVVVLYFGFTHCPDICPTSLSTMSKAFETLKTDEALLVQPIFVSVDYKRDSAETTDSYIKYYIPAGLGLTGDKKDIDKTVKQYGAFYQFVDTQDSAFEYTVDHTSRFYIIDGKGRLVKTVMDAEGAEVLAKEIKKAVETL